MDRLDYDLTGGQGYDLREVGQAPGWASAGASIWYALQLCSTVTTGQTHWGWQGLPVHPELAGPSGLILSMATTYK